MSPPLLEIVLQFTIDKGKNIIKFEQSVSSMAYAIKINKRERKKIERRIKGRSNIKEVDELTYQDDEQVSSFDSKKKTFRLYGHSPTYNLLQSECQWITLTKIYSMDNIDQDILKGKKLRILTIKKCLMVGWLANHVGHAMAKIKLLLFKKVLCSQFGEEDSHYLQTKQRNVFFLLLFYACHMLEWCNGCLYIKFEMLSMNHHKHIIL